MKEITKCQSKNTRKRKSGKSEIMVTCVIKKLHGLQTMSFYYLENATANLNHKKRQKG